MFRLGEAPPTQLLSLDSRSRLLATRASGLPPKLAARIGVDRRTVAAIEAGAPAVSIGNVFNAADILRVPLFGAEDRLELGRLRREGRDRLALLPTRVDAPRKKCELDDDF